MTQSEAQQKTEPKMWTKTKLDLPKIDELAGWVSRERAMEIMGITSPAYLYELVQQQKIEAARWDDRTLLYNRRSVERYHRERQPRKREQE